MTAYAFDVNKYVPDWIKAGFIRIPGSLAAKVLSLNDCAPDSFCYQRKIDNLEELIYFVDGWYDNDEGNKTEIFAWKALIRHNDNTIAKEYCSTRIEAFEELKTLRERNGLATR